MQLQYDKKKKLIDRQLQSQNVTFYGRIRTIFILQGDKHDRTNT